MRRSRLLRAPGRDSSLREPGGSAAAARAGLDRVRKELVATRTSLRDPTPGVQLPEDVLACIERVLEERLTRLKPANLAALARIVDELERTQRPGLLIEAGTARGGASIVMARAKAPERSMKVYDVFGLIPPPSDRDGADVHARYAEILRGEAQGVGGDIYYGYRENLYDEVVESFARHGVPVGEHGVDLVKGLFQDTIALDEPVAFAHLDCDWHESTLVCLERIAPLLVPGGRIVVDDYYTWSGCRAAVDEYFSERPGYHLERRTKLHVVRI